MKLFAINETEWIAANTKEQAIEFSTIEPEEVILIDEIQESEWDAKIECYSREELEDVDPKPIIKTIRELMQPAIESGKPMTIMSED